MTKLQFIEDTARTTDRNLVWITKIVNHTYGSHDTSCNYFIISANGNLMTETIQLQGSFAACVESNFSFTGHGLVIKFPGLRLGEEYTASFKPDHKGQLSYIDGCSNTNLISPPRNGDPCVNYLYFPKNITQSRHTHPSVRIAYVMSGQGIASLDDQDLELKQGDAFILDRHVIHGFNTSNSSMSLVVFHPDSEDGPRDEFNPMKSRTYIR